MAIDYKVSVSIPKGLFGLYYDDENFKAVLNDAIEGNQYTETNIGCYEAVFDNLDDAVRCERKLIDLFDEYDAKRDSIVNRINHIQSCISSIIADTEGMMQEFLKQDDLEINQSLMSFLSSEATMWQNIQNNG